VRGRGQNQAGEGIGLSIVKRLVDDFDFQINYHNRSEGGLCVTLRAR
jgi:K+-sensing histidine kinase KdpD